MEIREKLKIKEGMHGKMLNVPPELSDFENKLKTEHYLTNNEENLDFIVDFVATIPDVDNCIPIIYELKFDGLLWMAYPKKTSKIPSELTRDFGWKGLNEIGYQEVALVAINKDWTALRFRNRSLIKGLKH